jgi:hypothetical protein
VSAPKKLDGNTESQVVAMLARNDTQQQIVDWLKSEKGIEMSVANIGVIKKRNTEAITFMRGELVKHETTIAATILDKSRRLIDKKLDKALSIEDELTALRKSFDDGKMNADNYYREVDIVLRNRLSVQELNALSKEAFNQSQIEAGKPTSITESPEQAKAHLAVLLAAIANGDEAAALKAIFPSA